MSYVALYRAYRPQRFSEIAGQQVIVKTLQNALLLNKIAHAYLFSGPRGTGKTSIAKIFAKAVNCEDHVNAPCLECEVCQGLESGAIGDIIEIDAASNNGVDEIRELIDKTKYMPSRAKYKVYIIDEVHMFTTGAFNALLKTLEEPPKYVIFILATTEIHKIPATILSRCQRFDFKNIEEKEIVKKLNEIVKSEKIDIDDEAVKAIAWSATGGMRDALSLLDQVISYSDGRISTDDVHSVFGSISEVVIRELLEAILLKDSVKAITILEEAVNNGKEIFRIISDLMVGLKDVLLEKNGATESKKYFDISTKIKNEQIYFYLDILNELQKDIKWSFQKKALMEVALIKMMEHRVISAIDHNIEIEKLRKDIEDVKKKVLEKKPSNNLDRKALVTATDIEQILNNGDKVKKAELIDKWSRLTADSLNDYASMLQKTEIMAVSKDQKLLLTHPNLGICQQFYEDKVRAGVLEILKDEIVDYKVISKDDSNKVVSFYKQEYNRGVKVVKMPPYDFKLYQINTIKKPEKNAILDKAYEYFDKEKIRIKE